MERDTRSLSYPRFPEASAMNRSPRDGFGHALSLRLLLLTAGCAAWINGAACPVAAQPREMLPSTGYSAIFKEYNEGRYASALRLWTREGRGGVKSINGRWIDSICYHTMAGECHYQMGQYSDALEQYTAALNLFDKYSDWMLRIHSGAFRPSGPSQVKPCPWGRSTRTATLTEMPDHMTMSQGSFNANKVIKQGGVVEQPVLFAINAVEIVRCTTLAMRRRRELLGPACPHDSLSADLVAKLLRRPIAPNDWKEAWIDVQLGLAYAAQGNDGQAKGLLQRGMLAQGQYDHNLTCVALFELGRIALSEGDLPAAAKSFEEASYSAFHYGDINIIEDSLKYGALTHLLSDPKEPYPPLAAAADWARVKGITTLRTSCMLAAAEQLTNAGRTSEAIEVLANAKSVMANRDIARAKSGGRLAYLTAITQYQQGKVKAGDEALAPALAEMRAGGSLWLFHIGLADNLATSGKVSDRVAMGLYENVLREPQRADWLTDPLEPLTVLSTPHPQVIDHWFEVALARKEFERALEISDIARRHRFHITMPFGGRLLGLEWMMEGPDDLLGQEAVLQRQDLLVKHPRYSELARRVRGLHDELSALSLVPDQPDIQRGLAEKLGQLAEVSRQQEVLLREVAASRQPSSLIFPPLTTIKEIQKGLSEKQALLVFFATGQRLYGCLLSHDAYPIWEIGSTASLRKQIEAMLRGMGHFENNSVVPVAELKNDAWRKAAASVLELLMKGSKAKLPGDYEELVIVPDSLLWYLPFEALPVGDDGRSLISQVRIRYAPTISLSLADLRPRKQYGNTAVVTGRMFPGTSDSAARAAFDQLSQSVKRCAALTPPLPAPSSIYATMFDRLVVLDDLVIDESNPYAWSPVPIDRGTPGNSLESWMALPWGAPDQVVLPGYHTPAENALKKLPLSAAGSDVFLSVCGLMASGSRTILLSRWRTGGQTSFDLTREFVQELPHLTASAAWQRSVLLTSDAPLSLELEPRIKASVTDEIPTAAHPFFWSGYLLVDSGAKPYQEDEPEPAKIELKQQAAAAADAKDAAKPQ
jgi:tetratricopeptide (TPR) repeat protein